MGTSHFSEIPAESLRGSIVVLDVDGTLVPDCGTDLPKETADALTTLSSVATVYLCSNAQSPVRLDAFGSVTGANVVHTSYKKPSLKVLTGIPLPEGKRVVVIGDRYLTDGLLAKRLGAEFIMVKRLRDNRERLFVRILYVLDALLGPTVCSLGRRASL
jgi:predicted HAD superfamily phosphohydrolase YqeG